MAHTSPQTRHSRGLLIVILLGVIFFAIVIALIVTTGRRQPPAAAPGFAYRTRTASPVGPSAILSNA